MQLLFFLRVGTAVSKKGPYTHCMVPRILNLHPQLLKSIVHADTVYHKQEVHFLWTVPKLSIMIIYNCTWSILIQ